MKITKHRPTWRVELSVSRVMRIEVSWGKHWRAHQKIITTINISYFVVIIFTEKFHSNDEHYRLREAYEQMKHFSNQIWNTASIPLVGLFMRIGWQLGILLQFPSRWVKTILPGIHCDSSNERCLTDHCCFVGSWTRWRWPLESDRFALTTEWLVET